MFFGGHADGNPSIYEVALREAKEESGILDLRPIADGPIDLDIHKIPENLKEREHYHYDMRYLFYAEDENYQLSDESIEVTWVNFSQIEDFTREPSVLRTVQKAKILIRKHY